MLSKYKWINNLQIPMLLVPRPPLDSNGIQEKVVLLTEEVKPKEQYSA